MSKLVELNKEYWPAGGYGHWCPGCGCGHEITVDALNASGAKWEFNGDLQRPTFHPSINLQVNPPGHQHYKCWILSVPLLPAGRAPRVSR